MNWHIFINADDGIVCINLENVCFIEKVATSSFSNKVAIKLIFEGYHKLTLEIDQLQYQGLLLKLTKKDCK